MVQLQTSNAKKNLPAAVWWLDAAAAGPAGAPGVFMPAALLQVPSASGAAAGADAAAVSAGGAAVPADSVLSAPSGENLRAYFRKNTACCYMTSHGA